MGTWKEFFADIDLYVSYTSFIFFSSDRSFSVRYADIRDLDLDSNTIICDMKGFLSSSDFVALTQCETLEDVRMHLTVSCFVYKENSTLRSGQTGTSGLRTSS